MTPIPPPDINWLAVVPSGLLVLTAILVLFWDLWIQEEDPPPPGMADHQRLCAHRGGVVWAVGTGRRKRPSGSRLLRAVF